MTPLYNFTLADLKVFNVLLKRPFANSYSCLVTQDALLAIAVVPIAFHTSSNFFHNISTSVLVNSDTVTFRTIMVPTPIFDGDVAGH